MSFLPQEHFLFRRIDDDLVFDGIDTLAGSAWQFGRREVDVAVVSEGPGAGRQPQRHLL